LRGTYLELGPDIGLAADAARSVGAPDRMVLVEPNEAVHSELRAAAGDLPTEVVTDLSMLRGPGRADVAVLIHVLDHLTDPAAFLERLHHHLSPGASVLVVVHNERSMLRRALGVRWPAFCMQHPQLFSPDTLRSMLSRAGLDVVACRPTTNHFPLRHLVHRAATLFGVEGRWNELVPELPVSIRLGNIMAIARA
jgi:hypothetical protein